MALPVNLRHRETADPTDIVRRDLSNVLGRFFGAGLFREMSEDNPLAALASYGVDIREDADHVYVEADLPGFRKEDVDIAIEDGILTISAEHQEEKEMA